jgi:hypothetical protein
MSAVRIEAYDWTFEKQRIFVLGGLEDALGIFQHIQQDLLFRGRKVLVIVGTDIKKTFEKMKLFQQTWDFVLHVKANIDYSIFASYIQHQPKPISILWIGSEVPSALLQKFERDVYWICYSGNLPTGRDITHVFISPSLPVFKYKDWFLAQQPAQAQGLLENLEDMREKKAGIVFSHHNRSVQWYDAGSLEENDDDTSIGDVKDILKWCVEKLENQ